MSDSAKNKASNTNECLIVLNVTATVTISTTAKNAQCCQCYDDYICLEVNSGAPNTHQKHRNETGSTHANAGPSLIVCVFYLNMSHKGDVWYTLKQLCWLQQRYILHFLHFMVVFRCLKGLSWYDMPGFRHSWCLCCALPSPLIGQWSIRSKRCVIVYGFSAWSADSCWGLCWDRLLL